MRQFKSHVHNNQRRYINNVLIEGIWERSLPGKFLRTHPLLWLGTKLSNTMFAGAKQNR